MQFEQGNSMEDRVQQSKLVGDFEEQSPTTVMIKNISCRSTGQDVEALLDEAGLQGWYTYVYIPCRHSSKKKTTNFGYAFVNFVSPAGVQECYDRLNGRSIKCGPSVRPVEVLMANRQEHPGKKRSPVYFPAARKPSGTDNDVGQDSQQFETSSTASTRENEARSDGFSFGGCSAPPGLELDFDEAKPDFSSLDSSNLEDCFQTSKPRSGTSLAQHLKATPLPHCSTASLEEANYYNIETKQPSAKETESPIQLQLQCEPLMLDGSTLLLHGLPSPYTATHVMFLLIELGFDCCFDLVQMSLPHTPKAIVSSTVHFKHPVEAARCHSSFLAIKSAFCALR